MRQVPFFFGAREYETEYVSRLISSSAASLPHGPKPVVPTLFILELGRLGVEHFQRHLN